MDPYFDVALADVRGLDLGDDTELLAELHARRLADRASLTPDDWMLLGALSHRAGADDDAQQCLDMAARSGHLPALARYLQSQMRLDLGRVDDAERLLDLATEASRASDDVPLAELIHARGSIDVARGNPGAAIGHYDRALELEPNAGRALHLAPLLLEQGNGARAVELARLACRLEPAQPSIALEAAAVCALAGRDDAALDTLALAIDGNPALAETARADDRFTALAQSARFEALTPPPGAVDLEWLGGLDESIEALSQDATLRDAGIRWLSEEESLEQTEAFVTLYAERGPIGTLHTEATLALSRELLQGRRVVAQASSRPTRSGKQEPSFLLVDTRAPETIYIALSVNYPPFLWIDVQPNAKAICEAFGPPEPPASPNRLQLSQQARGFMGYRLRFGVPSPYGGEIVPANALELDQHFALNPFLEIGSWGSSYADDPWPDEIPEQPDMVLKFSARQKRVAEQAQGSVWSLSRRSRHSRSYVGFELHHRDAFVFDIRYAPAPHGRVIARVNEHFGSDYPSDMPLDVVATLLGFRFDSDEDLQAQLEATADPDEIAALLSLISALRHNDLSVTLVYRRYIDHPDPFVRATLCNIFAAYNHESMLEEFTVNEPDDELREQVEAMLDEGISSSEFDPYADYELDEDAVTELVHEGESAQ